jgi:hypothetical protein
LPLFLATALTGLAPSILAAVLTYLLWSSLQPIASSYHDVTVTGRDVLGPRPQRWMRFASTLIVIATLGIQAIASLGYWIGESNYRIPEIVLFGSLIAIAFAYGMFSMWWKFGYALVAALILLGAGLLGVWIALDHLVAPRSMAESWGMNAIRLAVLFLAAEWLNWLSSNPFRKRTGWAEHLETELGLLTPAFVVAYAFLAQSPGSLLWMEPLELGVFAFVTAITAAGLLLLLSKSRVLASRDFRWIGKFWTEGSQAAGPATTAMFTAIAMTPALALAPLVNWPAWILVFGMGLFATILKAWSSGPRPKRTRAEGGAAPATSSRPGNGKGTLIGP